MRVGPERQVRWPAWAMAVLFLGYAGGKALFAAHGKLGFPGGPTVPAAEYDVYAREMMDVSTAQWLVWGGAGTTASWALSRWC